MSLYDINGAQFEYDEMDLVNIELYGSEVDRLRKIAQTDPDLTDASAFYVLKEQCEAVLDFFDCVVGEGTSDLIFHGRKNIEEILTAFSVFTDQVAANINRLRDLKPAAPIPVNREQRRAQEREQRRQAAAARANTRAHAD